MEKLTQVNLDSPLSEEEKWVILDKLQGLVKNTKWSPTDTADLFVALLERFDSRNSNRSHLFVWLLKILHLIECNFITPTWRCRKGAAVDLVRDASVSDAMLQDCFSQEEEKQLAEIIQEIRQDKSNQVDATVLSDVQDIVSSVSDALRSKNPPKLDGIKGDLLRLCRAAETAHFRPRLTQMVSWCILALSKTGKFLQVATGEGKSCIVAMFAAYRAMRRETVHILTSSLVLAQRDMETWHKLFETLGIKVDCNTNKEGITALKDCYQCQVIYGTAERFAGDYLRQCLERIDIFGQKAFQCAIVDEVDSIMLDKALHVIYLSGQMPALQHLNSLLALIWSVVNRYSEIDPETGGSCRHLYRDERSVLSRIREEVENSLRFTPCERTRDEACCYVPGFLSGLVKLKLEVWIRNALVAEKMTEDHEYVLESHGIVPVDYRSTGVLENFMTWSDGLHQFLEMKHNLKLSNMTPISNYMSNVCLLQMYEGKVFGLTGTLGQQAEVETLQKLYHVETCRIPAFKRKKLFEVEGVVVDEERDWIKTICNVVSEQIQATSYRGQRTVLVICETINQAKTIHSSLRDQKVKTGLFISNNMDNRAIFEKELEGGDTIIATNLAGRGADFKVSDQVKTAGGLFVVQTFLPENSRVEAQAFGRTARQGSPGSAQLIVCRSHLPKPFQCLSLPTKLASSMEVLLNLRLFYKAKFMLMLKEYQRTQSKDTSTLRQTLSSSLIKTSDSEIKRVKTVRDRTAAKRLSTLLEVDIPKMKMKEELFQQFLRVRDTMPANSSDREHSVLNECWGLWLLTNSDDNDSAQNMEENLSKDLDNARKLILKGVSPFSNLHHYTAAGNELMKSGSYRQGIEMFTRAIVEDPWWAAFAYYNRAFAYLGQNKNQDQNCIRQAMEDLQQAKASVKLYHNQIEFTYRCSKEVKSDLLNTRFGHHLKTQQKVLMALEENIDAALKKLDKARAEGKFMKVHKSLVYFLEPVNGLLVPARVLLDADYNDPLEIHRLMSHPSFDLFNEPMCLESLGLPYIYTLDTLFSLCGFLTKIFLGIFDQIGPKIVEKWIFPYKRYIHLIFFILSLLSVTSPLLLDKYCWLLRNNKI